jgi:HAAS domain-containing protein
MADADIALRKMEEYLKQLRGALGILPKDEARDIVEEIRSHIRDCGERDGALASEEVAATLERLGPPLELASKYRMESLAKRAQRTRSPWLVLRTIFHWAGLSLNGAWVLLVSLMGYALAAAFLISAIAKPFNPQRVGLWRLDDPEASWSLHLGFREAPHGTEVLGWWMVPLGLLVGSGVFLVTVRYGLRSLGTLRRTLTIPGR